MIRKALAVFSAAALLLAGPEARSIFAAAVVRGPVSDAGAPYAWNGSRWIPLPTIEAAAASLPGDLGALNAEIKSLDVAPEMRARAEELLSRRLAPFLSDPGRRPDEVENAIRKFRGRIHDRKADPEIALAELFDGLQEYAGRMEQATNFQDVVLDNEDGRVVRITNAAQHRLVQENRYQKLSPALQRVEVFRPDPDRPGRLRLDTIAFLSSQDGLHKQKIVWSRQLLEGAKGIKSKWLDMPGTMRRIKDPRTRRAAKEALRAAAESRRARYEASKIDDVIRALDEAGMERLRTGKLPPGEIERLSRQLMDYQTRLQQFEAVTALEDVQKQVLLGLIEYFTKALGLQASPISEKDFSKMTVDDVQKRLNDFEDGAYGSYGLFGMTLAKVGIKMGPRVMDAERDMPPDMRRAFSQAIRCLDSAGEAKKRMEERGAGEQERDAARDALLMWTQQAINQIRVFEFYQATVSLEMLRDGKDVSQVRLRESSAAQAGRLIESVRGFIPKFHELEGRSFDSLLDQTASSFGATLQNARYMNLTAEELKEPEAVLRAKAKEMKALFLARRFGRFMENPANIAAFRKAHGDPSAYYGDQVKGGIYRYFLARLDEETKSALGSFDRIISRLESLRGEPREVRAGLARVQDELGALFGVLGLPEIPDEAQAQKGAQRLAVLQTWIDAATGQISSNLEYFSEINRLYLFREKEASSRNPPETRSKSRMDRALDWFKERTNFWGARDALADWATGVFSPETYRVLAGPEAKSRLAHVLKLLDEGRFNAYEDARGAHPGAIGEILSLDPEGAKEGELRYWLDSDPRAAEEYLKLEKDYAVPPQEELDKVMDRARRRRRQKEQEGNRGLLGQPLSGEASAAVRGAMTSAYDHLESYRKIYTIASIPYDLAVMTLLTPPLGFAGSLAFRWVGYGVKAAGEALTYRAAAEAGFGLRALSMVSRASTWLPRLAGEYSFQVGTGIKQSLGLGALEELGSSPIKTVANLGRQSLSFNVSTTVGVAMFGGAMQAANYAFSPSSYPNGLAESVGEAALGNAGWAARSNWLFFAAVPSAAVSGGWIGARLYRGFGNSIGPLGGAVRLAARMKDRLWGGAVAKAIVRNEEGVWGHFSARAEGLEFGGRLAPLSPLARLGARTAVGVGTYADNMVKFILFSGGVQEAVQMSAYAMTPDVKGPQKGSAPSAHLQRWALAHETAESAGNAAFLLMPQRGFASPKEMARSMNIRSGMRAFADFGGERLNRLFETPNGDQEKLKIKVGWLQEPVRGTLRVLLRLGPKEVEVPVEGELKAGLAETWLRRKGLGLTELLGIVMLPELKKVEGGARRAYYQKFITMEELRDAGLGGRVEPPTKEASKARVSRADVVFLIPELKDAAAKLIGERLQTDAKLAAEIRKADKTGRLSADGIEIAEPSVIRSIQGRMTWILIGDREARLRKEVMKRLRAEETAAGTVQPENLKKAFDSAWNRMIKQEEAKGAAGENMAWAMEKGRGVLMTDYLIEYNADSLNRKIGRVAEKDVDREADAFVARVNRILSFGGMKKGGTVITSLRSEKTTGRRGQEEALREFAKAVLRGKDPHEALRVFTLLEASGGKTILMKTAFVPLALARAQGRSSGLLGKAWNFVARDKRKVWVLTSNPHLVRQFEADWAGYSGGRELGKDPRIKVSSVDEALFEEVFRIERGERSIGSEYHFVFDEGDEPFRKPSHSIGGESDVDWSGRSYKLSQGHPLVDVRMKGLEWMLGRQEELRAKGLSKEQIKTLIRAEIPGMSERLAEDWRAASRNLRRELKGRGLGKEQIREMTKQARIAEKVIHEMFGRLHMEAEPEDRNPLSLLLKKVRGDGVYGWLKDDGLKTFMRVELERQLDTLALKDPTRQFRLDADKRRVVPVFFASEIPGLSTEHRSTAQLLLMRELARQGLDKTGDPVKWDLPLKHLRILQLNEFFERLRDAGADLLFTSGTAGKKVQGFLSGKIGVVFVNEEGRTREVRTTLAVTDSEGHVTFADKNGRSRTVDLSGKLKDYRIAPSDGSEAYDPETIRLMLHLTRLTLENKRGGNPLVMITPGSNRELEAMEKAILDSGLARDGEVVRYFPDYVHRAKESYEIEEMAAKNNADAVDFGEAKIVLLVPDIAGRGTDMALKDGKYTDILVVKPNGYRMNRTEGVQGDARVGPGRVLQRQVDKDGRVVQEAARVRYVDIASRESLLADTAKDGYVETVREYVRRAREADPQDETAARLKSLLPADEQAVEKLLDAASPEFKEFAGRIKVYRLMHRVLQEKAEDIATESSGIGNPSKAGMSKEKIMAAQTTVGAAVNVVSWLAGHPWLGALASMAASELVRFAGNLHLPKEDRAPSSFSAEGNPVNMMFKMFTPKPSPSAPGA